MLDENTVFTVLRGSCQPVDPVLFVSCLDCCPEPLSHFMQERHLQPLNELSAAHVSGHGAFGRIKIRRVINKLGGMPAGSSERSHAHRDEVQLFLPCQVGVFGDFPPLFGSRRLVSPAHTEFQTWRQRVRDCDIHCHRLRCRPAIQKDIRQAFAYPNLYFRLLRRRQQLQQKSLDDDLMPCKILPYCSRDDLQRHPSRHHRKDISAARPRLQTKQQPTSRATSAAECGRLVVKSEFPTQRKGWRTATRRSKVKPRYITVT